MRPKKVVLYVDGSEQRLSERRFLLETRGYRVLTATSGLEALNVLDLLSSPEPDVVVTELLLDGMDGNELVRRAKLLKPRVPCLLVSVPSTECARAWFADLCLFQTEKSPAELLERVRLLAKRKRGPKGSVTVSAVGQRAVAA